VGIVLEALEELRHHAPSALAELSVAEPNAA
jgi:hypothetical protein